MLELMLCSLLTILPDDPSLIDDLVGVLDEAGYELADPPPDGGAVRVYLPDTGDDGATAEDALLKNLRANGFAGQWPRGEAGERVVAVITNSFQCGRGPESAARDARRRRRAQSQPLVLSCVWSGPHASPMRCPVRDRS